MPIQKISCVLENQFGVQPVEGLDETDADTGKTL